MSGTYGFGIIGRLAPEAEGAARDELLLAFARLNLCPRFNELIGDRVLSVECGERPSLRWLEPREAEPIVAAGRALGADPGALVSAEDDRLMTLSFYGDLLLPDYSPDPDEDGIELELPETPLDGLRVGLVARMLADLPQPGAEAEAEESAPPEDAPDPGEADGAALDEELRAEAEFEKGLRQALAVCAEHKLVLAWSP